jgi:hypothetical protein
MRAHPITTKASTIVPGGILALGLAVVLLAASAGAATAGTASADTRLYLWCAPLPAPDGGCIDGGHRLDRSPFDFGHRQVGTTSPAQGFFLSASGTFNPSISVSGDYVQTSNCPPTMVNQSCLFRVTFTPTSTGPKEGTLSTGPGGPTAMLTGKGVTTRTPPVLPLRLDANADRWLELGRRGVLRKDIPVRTYIGDCLLYSCPDYDITLRLRGDFRRTTKQLAANSGWVAIKARPKHLKQLKEEPTPPKIKMKFVATDEFGQKATDEAKVTLCSRVTPWRDDEPSRCLWHFPRK